MRKARPERLTTEQCAIIDALYKTCTDEAIGMQIGKAKKTVWEYRKRNGLEKQKRPPASRHDEVIKQLYNQYSDSIIGEKIGKCKTYVQKRRMALGLHRDGGIFICRASDGGTTPSNRGKNKQQKRRADNEDYIETAKLLQSFLSRRAA